MYDREGLDRLLTVLDGGTVSRFHQSPGMPRQSLADHQWRASMVLEHLFPYVRRDVIFATLTHDLGENYTGDVPAPTKWAEPELRAMLKSLADIELVKIHHIYHLEQTEFALVKVVDYVELMLTCLDQAKLGNQNANRIFYKIVTAFMESEYHLLKKMPRFLHDLILKYKETGTPLTIHPSTHEVGEELPTHLPILGWLGSLRRLMDAHAEGSD